MWWMQQPHYLGTVISFKPLLIDWALYLYLGNLMTLQRMPCLLEGVNWNPIHTNTQQKGQRKKEPEGEERRGKGAGPTNETRVECARSPQYARTQPRQRKPGFCPEIPIMLRRQLRPRPRNSSTLPDASLPFSLRLQLFITRGLALSQASNRLLHSPQLYSSLPSPHLLPHFTPLSPASDLR